MRRLVFILVGFFLLANVMAQPTGYYNGTEGKKGDELKTVVHNIINQHIDFSYSDAKYILNYADSDPANESNIILFYTKRIQDNDTWGSGGDYINREHVWAKSHGDFVDIRPMDGDAFNLHPADASTNLLKSNYDFDECSDFGIYIVEADAYYSSSQDKFEPSDAAKGEVARTIFYMSVRYEGTDGEIDLEVVDAVNTSALATHGKLSTLLQWNRDFPPSDLERRRNERVYEAQRNRNPFIDNPDFADLLWGTAEVSDISIGNIDMLPVYPEANSTASISADITSSSSAITNVTLFYGNEYNSETNTISMTNNDSVWNGDISLTGFSEGDWVYYKISATNGLTSNEQHGNFRLPETKIITEISTVQGTGTATPMNGSIVTIAGIVTANLDNSFYIQSGNEPYSGMCIYDVRRGRLGDSVVITGKATEYNNLTEIADVSYIYNYGYKRDITPVELTIDQINESYEGMLVKFNTVTFLDGDTYIPLSNQATLPFTDGISTANVYSRYNSRISGKLLPSGSVDFTGVVSQYSSNYQILINRIEDIQAGYDADAPFIADVVVNDKDWIEVSFNEKLDQTSAETISNYELTGDLVIVGAYLYNNTKVLLLVTGLKAQDYTITVNGVSDLQNNVISNGVFNFHSDYTNTTGLESHNSYNLIIWPNPSQKEFLNIRSDKEIKRIEIFNLQGQSINITKAEGQRELKIDLTNIYPGVFIVHVEFENGNYFNGKLIIK